MRATRVPALPGGTEIPTSDAADEDEAGLDEGLSSSPASRRRIVHAHLGFCERLRLLAGLTSAIDGGLMFRRHLVGNRFQLATRP